MTTKSAIRLAQRRNHRARVANASLFHPGGAGTQYDFGQGNTPSVTNYWASAMAQDRMALDTFTTDWQAAKIVTIPVDDMLRDAWNIAGLTEAQVVNLTKRQDELGAAEAYRQAMRLEFLLGGAAIFLGVDDGQTDPSTPLDIAKVQRGGLRFINVIPRNRVQRVTTEMDPLKADYGKPSHYWVQGQQIHRSRLVLFTGDPLLPVSNATIATTWTDRGDGFGNSKLLPIIDDLTRATGSRQSAFQLVQRAGVFFAQGDFSDVLGMTADGETVGGGRLQALRDIVNGISVYRGAVIDVPAGQTAPALSTISPAFGSVPELVMAFLQVLSAASDIPATRFLGQAPGGLNATGESDLENYYGRIESRRTQTLRPQLLKFLRVLVASEFGPGAVTDALDVTFDPLWSLSEKEEAETKDKQVDVLQKMVDGGFCNQEQAVAAANKWEILPVAVTADEPVAAEPDLEAPAAPPLADSLAALTAPEA